MRKLVIGIAAAATLIAAPALAQISGDVRIGEPGASVRIGPDHPGYRARDEVVIDHPVRHDCSKTVVKDKLPNGKTIVRSKERC